MDDRSKPSQEKKGEDDTTTQEAVVAGTGIEKEHQDEDLVSANTAAATTASVACTSSRHERQQVEQKKPPRKSGPPPGMERLPTSTTSEISHHATMRNDEEARDLGRDIGEEEKQKRPPNVLLPKFLTSTREDIEVDIEGEEQRQQQAEANQTTIGLPEAAVEQHVNVEYEASELPRVVPGAVHVHGMDAGLVSSSSSSSASLPAPLDGGIGEQISAYLVTQDEEDRRNALYNEINEATMMVSSQHQTQQQGQLRTTVDPISGYQTAQYNGNLAHEVQEQGHLCVSMDDKNEDRSRFCCRGWILATAIIFLVTILASAGIVIGVVTSNNQSSSNGGENHPAIAPSVSTTFPSTLTPTLPSEDEVTQDAPSSSPTRALQGCRMNIHVSCQGEGCTEPVFVYELEGYCKARPTMYGLLFRGGNCSENNFTQPIEKVMCQDFGDGPPKVLSNETAYIIATGNGGNTFFEGNVLEGEFYHLYNGGDVLDEIQLIDIYSDEMQSTLLQSVAFDASCSQPLFLFNTFGASQIFSFSNPSQGNVSLPPPREVPPNVFHILVDPPVGGENAIIRELQVRTNYTNPVTVDFSPVVNGTLLSPDTPSLNVSFEAILNRYIPQAYEAILVVSGELVGSDEICEGVALDRFFIPVDQTPPGWSPV